MEAIGIALEIYLIAFVVAIMISFLIKGMMAVIKRITLKTKKETINE